MSRILSSDLIEHYNLFDILFVFSVILYSCLCCVLYAFGGSALIDIDTLIIIIFVFSVFNSFVKYKIKNRLHSFEKRLLVLLLFVFIMYLFLNLMTSNVGFYMDYLRGCAICLLSVFLGGDFRITDKVFNLLLWSFSITAVIVAVFFISSIGGIVIESSYGREIGKNSFGPILCYVFTIMLFKIVHNKVVAFKTIAAMVCLFTFIAIAVLRARTSMVVCVLILLLFLCKLMRENALRIMLYTILFLLVLFVLDEVLEFNIINKASRFISDALTVGHENDLTSGREMRNDVAMSLIKENIMLGNIDINAQIDWVHNYFLYILSAWGVLIGAPLLLLYIYLWIFVIKKIYHGSLEPNNLGYYLMLVPLITSLSESCYPLYPATTLFIAYFALGYAIKNHNGSRIFDHELI